MELLRACLRASGLLIPVLLYFTPAMGIRILAPLGGRRGRRFALRAGVACQRRWAALTLRVMGVELELEERPPRGCWIVVANHLSYVDVLVLASLFPGRFVAMAEIRGWPFLGLLARSASTIFVERGRRRDLPRVSSQMQRSLDEGLSILLFPEGRASCGASVLPFHSSLLINAAERGLPCLPVALRYTTPGGTWSAAYTVGWWAAAPLWPHLWGLLHLDRIRASVRWSASAVVGDDRKALAAECERRVAQLFEPMPQEPVPPGDVRALDLCEQAQARANPQGSGASE